MYKIKRFSNLSKMSTVKYRIEYLAGKEVPEEYYKLLDLENKFNIKKYLIDPEFEGLEIPVTESTLWSIIESGRKNQRTSLKDLKDLYNMQSRGKGVEVLVARSPRLGGDIVHNLGERYYLMNYFDIVWNSDRGYFKLMNIYYDSKKKIQEKDKKFNSLIDAVIYALDLDIANHKRSSNPSSFLDLKIRYRDYLIRNR